jgi:undecaprenyl-diphosphatase
VFGSGSANTQTAIAVAFAAFFLLRWWLGRWYESWVVAAAIVGELLIFLVVTAAVHRPRPPVHRLDVAPPTSSFPSGHTGAAVALYGCLAVIAWRYLSSNHRRIAAVLCTFLWLIPAAVAISRAYRGMHYPSDIVAGALGGALWLAVVVWTFKPGPAAPAWLTGHGRATSGRSADPAMVGRPGRR